MKTRKPPFNVLRSILTALLIKDNPLKTVREVENFVSLKWLLIKWSYLIRYCLWRKIWKL